MAAALASGQSKYVCMYLFVGKVKEGERGYMCYYVGYVTRKISIGYDTRPWKKANRKRGGLDEENGDGQLSIAANATISTANESTSTSSRERMHTEVEGEHEMD